MDLGLRGRKATVCASSQGLGLACARSLAQEGVHVYINGRDIDKLRDVAAELSSQTGQAVVPVCADIDTAAGRQRLIEACPEPDILVNNNAGPPPGRMEDWTPQVWAAAVEANMMAPIFMIQALLPGMRKRRFGRIVNVTSAMVKSPRPEMALSCAARTGLTAFAKAVSLDAARDNVTINQLLPERIDSPRQEFMVARLMASDGLSREEARARITASVAAKRFGTLREFGDACAFLCSEQASFISGQNLQIDGGSSPGLF
ncbi:SDR family oxidoreductase [Piscinibacter sp.]|uniref:SDR family oxidoreductase n=1 Tax=Piscinibacter sp. TaxID=1903157 RepID=UPI002C12C4D5|nr:SDR family oxidoreductase [Albitalea sp.]HUG21387.1 SDR family oxidoreductase [Albitalea sp.]